MPVEPVNKLGAETFSGESLDTGALIIPEIPNMPFFGLTV